MLEVLQKVNLDHWCCCGGTLQEEEAMLSEMEVTGQAFEDMQEQNVRLLQQLREKDDANFKLMSEVHVHCCWQFVENHNYAACCWGANELRVFVLLPSTKLYNKKESLGSL